MTLPETWSVAPLSDLIRPSTERVEPGDAARSPYIGLEHIEAHTGKIIGRGKAADVSSTKAVFRPGDILYGKLRPYLNKVHVPDFSGICSTDILVFKAARGVDSRYAAYALRRTEVVEFAHHLSSGVQLPRVSFSELGQLDIPVPPTAEQRRIVAAIERLTARVDAARERLDRVPAILKRFRQSVLAAACSGRLTEEWRLRNPRAANGKELAVTISESLPVERRPSQAIEVDFNVPDSWGCLRLEDLLRPPGAMSYGILKPGKADPKGVPMVRVMDLGALGLSGTQIMRVSPTLAADYRRTRIDTGDILLAVMATVGRAMVAPPLLSGANVNRALAVIKLVPLISSEYVCWVIRSPFVQSKFDAEKLGSAQARINMGDLRGYAIPIPSTAEQAEIVRRVESLFALADKVEQRVAAATARADKLTQAILAKAFRGELVPTEADLSRGEGRDYEPASVLLDRIRSDRETETMSARRKVQRRKALR